MSVMSRTALFACVHCMGHAGEEYQHPGHARQCTSLALQQLARQVPPDVEQTCCVMCELVELSSNDTEKLEVLREAREVLSQLASAVTTHGSESHDDGTGSKDGASAAAAARACFPSRHVEWLVSVAWNRGAHHARFLQ